ncbi:MAG: cob(I)yrinic acid a,c-diamide adenosyltransferase [Lachnospiraceae bacterium]|nr:cob(I)yrinic acid a,c-diamide adenosyltransferase [Lachnospiraceae bacterium]
MKGLIHIYCGDGKGKTSAAIGQAVRSAGAGLSVVVVRFLKDEDSGELRSLSHIPGIFLIPCKDCFGFYWDMDEEQKKEAAKVYGALFEEAWEAAEKQAQARDTVLVMDEIIAACRHGFVEKEKLLEKLQEKPERMEVLMTGRDPEEELLNLADYVSEIKKVKHPFDKGICARKGIEY